MDSPRRVVSATGLAELDSLLALSARPVAAGRFPAGWNPWAEEQGLGEVKPLAVEPEINIEQVARGWISSWARPGASTTTTTRSSARSHRPSPPALRTGA